MHRLRSTIASLGQFIRRARYRRAELWRMSAEMLDEHSPSVDRFRWVPWEAGGPETVLECPTDSTVVYSVTLPSNATIVSWCGLTGPTNAGGGGGPVTFEIAVQTGGDRRSAQCTLDSAGLGGNQRWRVLSVRADRPGAARVTFRTRRAAGNDDRRAQWGRPSIETPRPLAELIQMLRASVADSGVRGLWRTVRPLSAGALYRQWMRYEAPTARALAEQRAWGASATRRFSLITLVEPAEALDAHSAANTVIEQTYPLWEWIVVAPSDGVAPFTRPTDSRIRVITLPRGTSCAAAWNAGLRAAQGEFAGLLGQHDQLAPSALYEMARVLDESPILDLLYSDEDRLTRRGSGRTQPCFKPDWSPERLLASNYIGRLSMVRVSMALGLGGFREGFDGAEEWDLLLRLSSATARITRVPRCLYHRGEATEPESNAGRDLALTDHLATRGLSASVARVNGEYRAVWKVKGQPTVSVIVPNRDAAAVLTTCVRGLLEQTTYAHIELVVVDNGSTDPGVLDLYRSLEQDGRARVVPFNRPFNFSAACNLGAAASRGDLLLFLNNDIEVIEPDWLEELVRWAQLPEVGVVGAKLLFPDRTVQHAGVVFGLGLVGHIFAHGPEGASTLFGSTDSYRNYVAVTGACQMMRRGVFLELGGFDERFRLVFSDVVFCLKARKAGYRVVYTPHARLVHHESHTRKRDDSPEDMELLAHYLRESGFEEDPYFHPELSPKSATPALRPPLDPGPRQVVHDYVNLVLAGAERRAALDRRHAEAR